MNHPNYEELIDFLDGQLASSRQDEIASHLADCDECSRNLSAWRDARHELQSWELTPRLAGAAPRRTSVWPGLARVAAAIVFVGLGFGLARLAVPPPDADQIRADVFAQVRDELRSELQTEWTAIALALATEQRANQVAILRGLQQLDARWLADFGSLRKDIETVAVRTQEEFARRSSSTP
jgi:anti-sigma factor RsiW